MSGASNPSQLENMYGVQKYNPPPENTALGNDFHGYSPTGVSPDLLSLLNSQATGQGPSGAQGILGGAANNAANLNAALVGSNRGNQNPGVVARQIAQGAGNALATAGSTASQTKLGEEQGAMGGLSGAEEFNANTTNAANQYGANAAQNQAQFLEGQDEYNKTLNSNNQNALNSLTTQLILQNQGNANNELSSGVNGAIAGGQSLLSALIPILSDENAKTGITSAEPDLSSFLNHIRSISTATAPLNPNTYKEYNSNAGWGNTSNAISSGVKSLTGSIKSAVKGPMPTSPTSPEDAADNANSEGPGVQLMPNSATSAPDTSTGTPTEANQDTTSDWTTGNIPSYVGHPALTDTDWTMGYLPMYGDGGIVTKPTKIIAGDKGPEAMVPLNGPVDPKAFLDQINAYKYRYKDPEALGASPGEHYGPMAQELEKAGPVGKSMVKDTPGGKMVDYGKGMGVQLAALAELNARVEALEKKKGKK